MMCTVLDGKSAIPSENGTRPAGAEPLLEDKQEEGERKKVTEDEGRKRIEEERRQYQEDVEQKVEDEARRKRESDLKRQRTRELVLQARQAPNIEIAALSLVRKQRAALDRCCALYRMILERDRKIEELSRELVEAKHKLSNARLGVGPMYDLIYENDIESRLPTSQIAIMAMLTGALLWLF